MPEIIATKNDIAADIELKNYITLPISCLDPSYPGFSKQAKYEILKAKYYNQLIADRLETGCIGLIDNNIPCFRFKNMNFESVAGFIFESYIVNQININKRTIGRRLFELCTKRQKTNNDYIDQFSAIGMGFISTDQLYPGLYNRSNNADIIFIRQNKEGIYEPATVMGTTNTAGIQVKAITCGEKEAIVDKVLRERYSCVLTLLSHRKNGDWLHSATHCRLILKSMREIDPLIKNKALMNIVAPEDVGLDQHEIDDYYQFILAWMRGQALPDDNIFNGVGMEIKTQKYSEGVLVPNRFTAVP